MACKKGDVCIYWQPLWMKEGWKNWGNRLDKEQPKSPAANNGSDAESNWLFPVSGHSFGVLTIGNTEKGVFIRHLALMLCPPNPYLPVHKFSRESYWTRFPRRPPDAVKMALHFTGNYFNTWQSFKHFTLYNWPAQKPPQERKKNQFRKTNYGYSFRFVFQRALSKGKPCLRRTTRRAPPTM